MHSLLRDLQLGVAQADAGCADAVPPRGVGNQRSPATAHVEKTLAGMQLQLAADELELRELGELQPVRARCPVGARVDHLLVEKEPVEVVAHVVVVPDRRVVPGNGVARGGAEQLTRARTDLGDQPRGERGRRERLRPGPGGRALDEVRQVAFHVEVAGEAGLGHLLLGGRSEGGGGPLVRHHQHRNAGGVERRNRGAVPEPYPEGTVLSRQHRLDQRTGVHPVLPCSLACDAEGPASRTT